MSDKESPYAAPYKPGVKRVHKCSSYSKNQDWYDAYVRYTSEKKEDRSLSYGQFLASSLSGPKFSHTRSQCNSMGKFLKKFDAVKLEQMDVKRARKRKFALIDAKLVQYLELNTIKYQRDKCGVFWLDLRIKCLNWYWEDPSLAKYDFDCSPGWMSRILKRKNLVVVKMHGEANKKKPEEEAALMVPWLVEFHKLLEDKGIDWERV